MNKSKNAKNALTLALVVLISAVVISGCVQQGGVTPGGSTSSGSGNAPPSQLTQSQKDSQAAAAVDAEMTQYIDNASFADIENQLLAQG
jgi:hypothetical protein